MFSLSTWIWLIERNDLVDFVPNGYDKILLALTPQRPNIDFGLFIRPFTVQAWRGIGITFAIIITCIILPYMTLRGLHYSNTDRYVIVTVIRVLGFSRGVYKIIRFLPEDQHTQRKLLNFENWCSGELSKIGHYYTDKVI